jgi:voltage-gated potassium channel Kch
VNAWLRYRFDNMMARGPIALIGLLGLVSATIVLLVTLAVLVFGIGPERDDGRPFGFYDTIWFNLMRTLDPGTMGGDSGRWSFLFAMLAITLAGIFIVSTLIGLLSSGIEAKLDDLRKGRSFVLERGHTVILGWSPQIFTIVSELALANANQRKPRIAILAEKDKVEMDDELRERVGKLGRTKVVCRTGIPLDPSDLEIVNPHDARSIIVLSPESARPDARVLKTILALTNSPHRRPEPYHIVAEIRNPQNIDIARMVSRDETQFVLSRDVIARIAVQTSRQSGLSVVYTELLDFGGDEIYIHDEPALIGRTYGDALMAYEDSSAIGIRTAGGAIRVNPPMETVISAGDQIIAVSEDDDTVRLSRLGEVPIDIEAIVEPCPRERIPERTLILGWNIRAPAIAQLLDANAPPGSVTMLVADPPEAAGAIDTVRSGLVNLTLEHLAEDAADRATLDRLRIEQYERVIVLSSSDHYDPQFADSRTLVTLLHLRDIADRGGYTFSIVSEMIDIRNRQLAEVTRADDFIVSDRLVSLLMTQISENRDLAAVFADLFDPAGSEIYLKPATDYVVPGYPVTFYTVVEAARRRGESAFGYRLRAHAGDATRSYGVVVNPDKSTLIEFSPGDNVIVLAED